ncbi:MAG: hypothetical protein JWO35_36 [Candidatus Saccharibacteria bacterium]|nr:hypothetical protein [Candidatus Saccharibacteria bacterium]
MVSVLDPGRKTTWVSTLDGFTTLADNAFYTNKKQEL